MLQIGSNCSPIRKVNQSFGRNDVITATADWLENIDENNISEDSFNDLRNITEKMHDGPLKTFITIVGIAGATFFATRAGVSKMANKLNNNQFVQKNVLTPFSKLINNGITSVENVIKNSPYISEGATGFKSYFVKTADKTMKFIKKFAEEDASAITKSLSAKISTLKATIKNTSDSSLKEALKKELKILQERKSLASTENLINKVTSNAAAIGTGTVAIVETNKDNNKNGIADFAEYEIGD